MNGTVTPNPNPNATADTVRIPLVRPPHPVPRYYEPQDDVFRSGAPKVDAARLWTGGLATAVVAALVGLVGVLLLQVLARIVPQAASTPIAHGSGAALLCAGTAIAALVATGLAHLLVISTPRPVVYLGWIVGLATTAAAVLPLTAGLPLTAAVAEGVINVVVGMAISSLVTGVTVAAMRSAHAAR
jgi:hypothetical protein